MSNVQDANKKGLVASEWTNTISSIVGGKAGGKGPTSLGNGTNPGKIDEAVEAATKYLEKFSL